MKRPDLRARKWTFNLYNTTLNSPGYGVVAPCRGVNSDHADESWVGPAIYDSSNGELVWSGGPLVNSNVEDFRVSEINGERLITFMAHSKAYVLNPDYSIRNTKALETWGTLNTHELNFVNNGTRAIILRNNFRKISTEAARTLTGMGSTNAFSRGLLIAIDESRMEASVQAHCVHPYHARGPLVPRRGNYQLLPNGNVFMGWSERAMQSEHTPDGKVIWDAYLQVDWVGSYRNYKFDGFVGRPSEPRAAVSKAHANANGTTTTVIHVSWNGATEVSRWNLYKTSPDGVTGRILVDSVSKIGFETVLECTGYATHIVVEAVDKAGHAIGSTAIIATLADASIGAEAVAEGEQWLERFEDARAERIRDGGRAVSLFGAGVLCGVMALLLLRVARPQGIRMLSYHGYRYVPVA